ncbi:unnamed protein product [Alopecurus aequalis]
MDNALASSVGATSHDEQSLTASAIMARSFMSHILRIDGYSYTKGFDREKFFLSEIFAVGGHLQARFTISLLHQDGNPVTSYICSSGPRTFSARQAANAACSFQRFIMKSQLEDSGCLKDDVFSVRCDVSTAAKEIVTKAIAVPAIRRVCKQGGWI